MSSPTDNPKLQPFSYVVLALIGERGAGAHDLVRMMRQGRIYWAASESHYYAEPKRLERLGLLRSERLPGATTQRRHYTLTERGREALVQWLGEPTAFTRIQCEAIVKVLASDLTDDASVAAGEELIPDLPHRARNLRLVHRYGRAMLDLHRQWVDEVERELGGGPGEV